MDWFGLAGKKYLVTGASSGIGQAAAIKISQLGGRVILNGRNVERLQQTLSRMEGSGHCVMPYDLANSEGIKEYVSACVRTDDIRFDGLVFSTGIGREVPIRAENWVQFQNIITTNYFSYAGLLMAFSSRRVLNDGGAIVAVSSSAALNPAKSQMSYSSSKAAIDAATIVASDEFVERKVRVNSVRPQITYTPMTQKFFQHGLATEAETIYPLDIIQAEDVANTIIFLLSDMSSKITGQQILISAGNRGRPVDLYGF